MYFFPVIGEKKGDSFALSRTPTEKKKKKQDKRKTNNDYYSRN